MSTAHEMARYVRKVLKNHGMDPVTVNSKMTPDSDVEHVIDLDINDWDGYDYTLYITVLRNGRSHEQ